MAEEISLLKQFFKNHNIPLSNEWLESCVEWCKNEILPRNYSFKDLQEQIFEQWLILDLRDIEVATLPPNLSSQKHIILKTNYVLQLMQIMDVSKPKLWQLQNIRKSNHVTSHEKPNENDYTLLNKRMLQLTLTDGIQEIIAIEFKLIPSLNLNLTPGCKIRLIAPLSIRQGRIMLESHNIQILDGEVDELKISHAAENVLARLLNLPLNPNPNQINDNVDLKDYENEQRTINRPQSNNHIDRYSNNVLDTDEEINLLLEAEQNILTETSTTTNSNKNSKSNTKPQLQSRNNLFEDVNPSSLDSDDDIFDNIDIDVHVTKVNRQLNDEKPSSKNPSCKPTIEIPQTSSQKIKPNITLAKLLRNKPNINKGIFRVKVKFKLVVEKLTINEEEFKLIIKVEDESGEAVVQLHNDLVAQLAGYSLKDILKLKENILNNDNTAAQTVMKALQNVKEKVLKLDNIVEIQVSKNEDIPKIRNIFNNN